MDQFNFKPVSTPSIKYLNWPSPVFGRFQNGCNEVVIEPRVVQFSSEIILVISNRTRDARLFDFSNHAYDFRPNCTPLSSITTLNHQRADETFLLYRYWWNTRIFPFSKKSYLHRAQWRYYLYLSRVRILVSPWLLTWLANYMREKSEKSHSWQPLSTVNNWVFGCLPFTTNSRLGCNSWPVKGLFTWRWGNPR